ncbi:MAG: hypothetical protein SGJ20_01065 [Planctomycetota bacterium]|nr:hypothetical protein [Planctomycetota bacterium]
MLFQFYDNTNHNDRQGYAWASGIYPPFEVDFECPNCKHYESTYRGTAVARIDEGKQWPDIMGNGAGQPSFVLSRRVLDAMREAGITGYIEHPVVIENIQDARLKRLPSPEYGYLEITGGIDLDLPASGFRAVGPVCSLCGQTKWEGEFKQFVQVADSWDGTDIFTARNYRCGVVYCSEKFLLLARQERWTNFRFTPLDAVLRHVVGWKGIDYLGKKWPPQWYPKKPSDGRTFEEWIELVSTFQIDDEPDMYPTHIAAALPDFGSRSVSYVLEVLQNGSAQAKKNAAYVLARLYRECNAELSEDVRRQILVHAPIIHPSSLHLAEPGEGL